MLELPFSHKTNLFSFTFILFYFIIWWGKQGSKEEHSYDQDSAREGLSLDLSCPLPGMGVGHLCLTFMMPSPLQWLIWSRVHRLQHPHPETTQTPPPAKGSLLPASLVFLSNVHSALLTYLKATHLLVNVDNLLFPTPSLQSGDIHPVGSVTGVLANKGRFDQDLGGETPCVMQHLVVTPHTQPPLPAAPHCHPLSSRTQNSWPCFPWREISS